MLTEPTFMIVFIIGTSVGAIIGATIYHLIVYRFTSDVQKQLKNTIKSYENLLLEKAKESLKEFQLLKEYFTSISNDITTEQKDIYESTHDIAEDLNTFFKALKDTQDTRVLLENEITKLKNINYRLTKQLKEK